MDALADVLAATKVGGTVTAWVHAAAPWGLEFPPLPVAAFHHVVQGACWLRRPGAEPVALSGGDLVLLAAGAGHVMAGDRDGPTVRFDDVASAPGGRIDLPGPGPRTRVFCGGYRLDARASHPLLRLPPVLVVRADPATRRDDLAETLRMLTAELADPAPGAQTIVDRLVDVLFVHILRHWAARDDGAAWLAALRDPEVAGAIALIHRRPGEAWTVAALADAVGVSRATLSRRFTRLVGEPPLAYLTRWRMAVAARRLRDTDESVTGVARAVGYTSAFAFSRAFDRAHGLPPSHYRSAQSR